MDRSDKIFLIIWAIIIVFLVGLLAGGMTDISGHYKKGQIDALTGKVIYELRVNSDSTITWHNKLDN